MNKSLLLSGVASVAAVSTAMAGDLPAKKVAPAAPVASAPAYSWTGISIGIGGGAQFLQSKDYVDANAYAYAYYEGYVHQNVDQNTDLGKVGAFGTVQIAADYQASGMVFGAFADYDFGKQSAEWNNNSRSCEVYYSYNGNNGYCSSGASVEIENSWDVGGRLGFLVSDRALVYGLAGYSWAKITTTAYNNGWNNNNNSGYSAWFYSEAAKSQTRGGLMLGAGVEYAFGNNMSLKAEYRHVDYGKITVDETYSNGNYSGASYITHESHVTTDSVRALLSYKF